MMRATKKPYDSRVEWIQAANGALINTQVTDVDRVVIKFMYGAFMSYYALFGNYKGEDYNAFRLILAVNTAANYSLAYPNTNAGNGSTRIPIATMNEVHELDLSQSQIVYDGTTFSGTINTTQGYANNKPLAIFARDVSDYSWYDVKMKCYYFRAWKSGNLVCDLIPVRVGTTGYMYGKVSGQLFGNAGSGSFILGNDI